MYRSDYLTTPFPKPTGRFAHIPVKSVYGTFDTSLNKAWDTVGPQIVDIIPGSTSRDTAHDVSQAILALLRKNNVKDVVVEWREAVPQWLAGPPLLRHASDRDATHYVRRFLTALLAVPLTTEDMEDDHSQGTLTLWFLENKTNDGKPSDKVYGLSNCHVLRKDTTVDYSLKGGAPKDHVRVCGMRRFQRGLDEITKAVADRVFFANMYAQDIARLQAQENQGPETADDLEWNRSKLEDENRAIASLERLHDEATKYWSNIKLQRNIGHVEYAPKIKVDEGNTRYTADWSVFVAAEAKVKGAFEGNVVDLGSKFSAPELTAMFYPVAGGATTFKYPSGRKLKISGCASKEDLAVPAEFDIQGERCLMVGKDGNTTDLTVGRYAGLESFTFNAAGVVSRELAIYNSGNKAVEVFSAKGDSGSLVWHMRDGKAYIVGQLHSGHNKGGSTSNHVTYCTPGWWLLAEIKKKYKNAVFYPETWPVRA
ncbi:hypothetical protein SCP_1702020 [Sparassis crispa]|uniref:Uncharacterized protein n=1 Tax=Sparassis crispa TaxID=139825 RepID=A0A401H603_9APHY|nr:hypothetical protein SCP_1702020 [Sparassis crispa]GBE89876.1 hypothetical protein SCP_1702020 [Sparassis crispa]